MALAALRSVWTFPAAIGSVVLLGIVVFEHRRYILYPGLLVWGLIGWRRAMRPAGAVPA